MPIELIDQIKPKNDGDFPMIEDDYLLGGYRVVIDFTARDAIPSNRRKQGMTVYIQSLQRAFELRGGITNTDWYEIKQLHIDNYEIYVNYTTGNNDNDGSASNPIKTINEIGRRIPFFGKGMNVYLSSGTHTLEDSSSDTFPTPVIQAAHPVNIVGDKNLVTSFVVDSVTNNVLTAQGTPNWTVDEHQGKMVERYVVAWDYTYYYRIIHNTADTLTLALTTSAEGGYLPGFSASDTVNIYENTTTVQAFSSNYLNRIYLSGNIIFNHVIFDGTIGGHGPHAINQAAVEYWYCDVTNWSGKTGLIGPLVGSIDYYGCWIDDCAIGISVSNNGFCSIETVYKDCDVAVQVEGNAAFMVNGSGHTVWNLGCYLVWELQYWGALNDHGHRIWSETGDFTPRNYVRLEQFANYLRTTQALIGWSGAKTFVDPVYILSYPARASLLDSANHDLTATGTFFRIGSTTMTLADYNAGNSPAIGVRQYKDDNGNLIIL
jgi:hypothetical protein